MCSQPPLSVSHSLMSETKKKQSRLLTLMSGVSGISIYQVNIISLHVCENQFNIEKSTKKVMGIICLNNLILLYCRHRTGGCASTTNGNLSASIIIIDLFSIL